jgi:hypothetical protein
VDDAADQRLAERVRQRQPQVLQVVGLEQAQLGLRHALPAPAGVQQLDALGPPGRAGGVDERCQVVGLDVGDEPVDELRVGRQRLGAGLLQLGQGHLRRGGGRVGGAVDQDHVRHRRQVTGGELPGLYGVFRDHHGRAGVGHDVAGVLGLGRRVDGGGGRASAHDAEVGDDPVQPRVGDDRHAVLAAHADAVQAGGDGLRAGADLAPGQPDRPGVVRRGVTERLVLRRLGDPLEKHVGNRPVRNVQRHIESRLMRCEVTAVTYGGCYRRVLPVSESGK